jgi:hypothetical protein
MGKIGERGVVTMVAVTTLIGLFDVISDWFFVVVRLSCVILKIMIRLIFLLRLDSLCVTVCVFASHAAPPHRRWSRTTTCKAPRARRPRLEYAGTILQWANVCRHVYRP